MGPRPLSAAMRRAIRSTTWTGLFRQPVPARTFAALVARELAWTERRRWRADRPRLTDKGLAVRAELEAAEHVVIDLDTLRNLNTTLANVNTTLACAITTLGA